VSIITLYALGLLSFPCLYPQLPSESVCEAYYFAACRDHHEICDQERLCSGWTAERLKLLECESQRIENAWFAAWWLAWTKHHFYPWREHPEFPEWERRLWYLIGPDDFLTGKMPVLLSLR
jgi:hypothetical protein